MLIELTSGEHDDLVSGYQKKCAIEFARQCHERIDKIQRDLIAAATHCQSLITNGKHPIIAAEYAREAVASYLDRDIAVFNEQTMPTVYACGSSVYGYSQGEVDVSLKVMRAAIDRLRNTLEDGSSIVTDAADILDQFTVPPSIW